MHGLLSSFYVREMERMVELHGGCSRREKAVTLRARANFAHFCNVLLKCITFVT